MAGALLRHVAFFLYEDEEARIQNRLEQIWKRIDALQSNTISTVYWGTNCCHSSHRRMTKVLHSVYTVVTHVDLDEIKLPP
jgi:hypothetical protein